MVSYSMWSLNASSIRFSGRSVESEQWSPKAVDCSLQVVPNTGLTVFFNLRAPGSWYGSDKGPGHIAASSDKEGTSFAAWHSCKGGKICVSCTVAIMLFNAV